MVPGRVDGPYDIAHRIYKLARQPGNRRERLNNGRLDTVDLPLDYFAQERNLSQAGANVVVQVCGDSAAYVFELRQSLFAAAAQGFFALLALLFRSLALTDVARDTGEEPPVILAELAERNLERDLAAVLVESGQLDGLPGNMPHP